jgi:peptidoglycan/xylan/chitin deacetylase (PgdA/CDA1 family)
MYHSVADDRSRPPWRHLATPVALFDRMMSYLKRRGFTTIFLDELYRHLSHGDPLPPRPIAITLDDGYLDNWVHAFPLLQRHGLKATIFVAPEFVDPTADVRPTLLDVWHGRVEGTGLAWRGFLSWNEMRQMLGSGLVDIQGHTLTHTCLFQGPRIVDFHHPGDDYRWLAWNRYPERKPRWLTEEQEDLVPFGTPVYEYGRALGAPRYHPDEALTAALTEHVERHGGPAFFGTPDWTTRLVDLCAAYRQAHGDRGRLETGAEYEARVRHELVTSKALIEAELGRPVRFLCWPGGVHNETTERIAREAGYLATTRGATKNARGASPGRIQRIPGNVSLAWIHPVADAYGSLPMFALKVHAYRGSRMAAAARSAVFMAGRAVRGLAGSRGRRPAGARS